jgi:hypothetical protein
MSRDTLARALLFILLALLLSRTVTPAQARPRGWEGQVLKDWKMCRNGAELTIGAVESVGPRLKLIVTSPASVGSGRERVLVSRVLMLKDSPLFISYQWFREPPTTVMDDTPDTPPEILSPPDEYRYSTTTKVWWSRPAGRTATLTMGPVGGELHSGTLRVGNCLLLPGTWAEDFDALTAWLWKLVSVPWPFTREGAQ